MTEIAEADGPVSWELTGRVCVVRLANPPANQIGPALVAGLAAAIKEFEAGDGRALVIASGLDGFFAAGADLKAMGGGDPSAFAEGGAALRAALDRLAALDRPSIAAIEGRALGGGLELALACTLRVASATARLGVPEAALGLIPGAGGTQRLPRLVGRGRALDMMLTGREVKAEEAHRMGLVDRLVEAGGAFAAAGALAEKFAAMSRPALEAVLRSADDADELPLADGMRREAERIGTLFTAPDAREGIAAFLERRPPRFA